ncbi:MAG: hypothetical protein HY260_20205 [Chloroflexi bacterium]|nr:hypothetical protein [Chloroflexota bacterium]
MTINHALPFVTTLVSLIFSAAVLARYFQRGGSHLLLWGIGLLLYTAGTFSEAFLALVWSPFVLRLWYLSGAMLTAAWLGQGTIHLLVRRRGVAISLTAILALTSLVAAIGVFAAPLTGVAYRLAIPVSAQYKEILTRPGLIVALTVVLNIYGSLGLIGGAIWSAWLFWRKRVLPNRVIGNVLIAAGALMPASAGSLIKAGLGDWLYLSELLGAIIMFIGFLAATAPQPQEAPEEKAVPATAGD